MEMKITDDLPQHDYPTFDRLKRTDKKKKHHNNKTTNQWVHTPMHSGTPTWFSSEGAVELIIIRLQ